MSWLDEGRAREASHVSEPGAVLVRSRKPVQEARR